MYQLLVDRFDDGQEHPLYDPKTAKHGRDRQEGTIFQGGKLKGITARLDYIKKLGCNAIWISPPFKQNADEPGSYHGYGIQDFLSIDPRFGTTEDLRELVRQAHDRGMFVILDIVLNHTANVYTYKDKETPYRKDGQYEFGDWHRVGKSKELGPDDAIWPIELQNRNHIGQSYNRKFRNYRPRVRSRARRALRNANSFFATDGAMGTSLNQMDTDGIQFNGFYFICASGWSCGVQSSSIARGETIIIFSR